MSSLRRDCCCAFPDITTRCGCLGVKQISCGLYPEIGVSGQFCRLSGPGSWCMPTAQEVSQLLFFLAGEWGLGRLVEELLNLAINLSRHQCIYSVEKLLFKVGAGNIQQPLLLRQLIQLFSQCRS